MNPSVEPVLDAPADHNGVVLHDLQRRVDALEHAVERLEDPRVLEERITSRLAQLPVAAAPPPEPTPPPPSYVEIALSAAGWGGRWSSWLFVDMWREGRTLLTLIFDPRYTMAWTSRLVVLVVLPLMLTAHWWLSIVLCGFPWIDALRGVLIACVNLVLAFVLFQALGREVRRYKEHARR